MDMRKHSLCLPLFLFCAALLIAVAGCSSSNSPAPAVGGGKSLVAKMYLATPTGPGKAIGTVTLMDTPKGLEIRPDLTGLLPGQHGFHVHVNPNCDASMADGKPVPAGAAGGHYDPFNTGKHMGPGKGGHLGDLPALTVAANGSATQPVYVSGVKARDFANRSLMIHAGGDNYADQPAPLGGGGARVACGIIE